MAVNNKFTVTLAGELLGTFDEDELTLDDAFELESKTGMTFPEMLTGVVKTKAAGMRALVWFMRNKRGDNIKIDDIRFKLTQLETDVVDDEVVENPTRAGEEPATTGASGRAGKGTPTSDTSPTSAT